ncbi:MAG TPA: hypothetical protein VGD40_01915 [Chryseosolibacter sp.]
MKKEFDHLKKSPRSLFLIALAVIGLCSAYLFQRTDLVLSICHCEMSPELSFALHKFFRVLMNDLCMLLIIHAWFNDSTITRLAIWIQLVDTFFLLPVYLLIKLSLEGPTELSSPLLSQFHRLIVNPTLLILLFPAVYFQRAKFDRNE